MTMRRPSGGSPRRTGRWLSAAPVGLVIGAILAVSAGRDRFGAGVAVAIAVVTVWLLAMFLPLRRR
ncbi:hypothetical protein ABTX15_28540 [Micromonospora sp. NPDC094482]|uniref:hypothetical protein n=1 Tax=unclassified Micromonospora TaxID=2617518 RepID=UPI00331D773A